MKKAAKKLREAYSRLSVRVFEGCGHGEIINHPDLLVSGIREFMEV